MAPNLIKFLTHTLETEIEENIFTEGYGEERALRDGKADQAFRILKLIRSISHDQ